VIKKLREICFSETLDYNKGAAIHTLTKVHYFYHTFPKIIHEPLVKHTREGGSTV
jgi:hypothetical protein